MRQKEAPAGHKAAELWRGRLTLRLYMTITLVPIVTRS